MPSSVLPYLVIIASVLILAVALRLFAGPDEPDNGTAHYQDGKRDGGSDPAGEPPDTSADRRDDVVLAA